MRTGLLSHIGIAVEDLESSRKIYEGILGFEVLAEKELESRGLKVLMLDTGNTVIELLEGTSPESAVSRFIEKRGPGIHHLCFEVEDIVKALADLSDAGMRLIDKAPRPGADGHPVAFLHPGSTGRVLIELEEKAPSASDGS